MGSNPIFGTTNLSVPAMEAGRWSELTVDPGRGFAIHGTRGAIRRRRLPARGMRPEPHPERERPVACGLRLVGANRRQLRGLVE